MAYNVAFSELNATLTKPHHGEQKTTMGYILLILAQCVVGISIVGSKYLIATMPTLFLLETRFLFATGILLFLSLITEKKQSHYLKDLSKKSWGFLLAQAITAGVLFNILMLWGLKYTNASIAGIITSALPAMISIMFCIFLKERFTLKKWLCIGFATLGLAIVSLVNFTAGPGGSELVFGACIILLALIPEASYYVLSKAHVVKLPVFLISALINGINAVLLLPIALLEINWQSFHVSLFQATILGLIGITSGLFYVFWYLGADKANASFASLSTAAMPISTIIIAWLTLGESITLMQFIGMCLVIISIVLCACFKDEARYK